MQIPTQVSPAHEQLILFIVTGVLTVAVIICGYFLSRLVSQMDEVIKSVKVFDRFIAQQEIKNEDNDKTKEDIDNIYNRLTIMDKERNRLLAEHELYMKKHKIQLED